MLIPRRRFVSTLPALKGLRLIALASLLFCVRALAQFEVAPDHFDSAEHQKTIKKKARALAGSRVMPGYVQHGAQSGSRAARGWQSSKDSNHSHVVAAHRRGSGKDQILAVSP
jgi:hypothetical protein